MHWRSCDDGDYGRLVSQDELAETLADVDRLFSFQAAKLADLARNRRLLEAVQTGAVEHADPYIRRSCLWALDHYANDESMHTFAAALTDDVHFVRDIALHSIACDSCKCQPAEADAIVQPLIEVLAKDPKPDLCIKALSVLLRFVDRDDVGAALHHASRANTDPVVRRCAADALAGHFTPPKKRYERSQRRHAAMGHGTPQR